uniref:Transmembrane protein 205 n=1 Tax=Cyprinus carpio carpio TaxID=630221 RepID=A0A8C1FKI4_CYPCA
MATEGDPTGFVKVLHLLVISFIWGMQVWVSFIAGFVLISQVSMHTFGLVQSKLFPFYFNCLMGGNAVSLAIYAVYHPRELLDWHEGIQRIHWRASDVMLHFSKSVLMNEQAHLHLGWSEGEYFFNKSLLLFPHFVSIPLNEPLSLCFYFSEQMTLFFVAVIMAGLNVKWFGPSATESMLVMHEIEKEHGLGNQVGMSYNKEEYAKLREQDPKYKEHRTTFYRYHGLSNLCNLIGFFSTTINLIYLALHLGTI